MSHETLAGMTAEQGVPVHDPVSIEPRPGDGMTIAAIMIAIFVLVCVKVWSDAE